MQGWGRVALTLIFGACFGWLMLKKKVPAGVLVGAICGSTLLNIATGTALMPSNAKLAAQITTGAFLGCGITRRDVRNFPQVAKPFAVVMASFLLLNFVSGFLIWKFSPLDFITSMLCSMPGGVSDTPLIAMDMGADVPKVAVLQFIRLVFGVGALPAIILAVDRFDAQHHVQQAVQDSAASTAPAAGSEGHTGTKVSLLLTLIVAALGGFFGKWVGVAAGALTFAMIFSLVFKLGIYPKAHCPLWLRRIAQLLSGCCIGSSIAREDIFELRFLVFPAVLLLCGYVLNCILIGRLLHRMFGLSLREGMLSVSPAGATEMAFVAADMGVNSPNLIVLQLCRLVGVMAIFPQIFLLVSRLLSL